MSAEAEAEDRFESARFARDQARSAWSRAFPLLLDSLYINLLVVAAIIIGVWGVGLDSALTAAMCVAVGAVWITRFCLDLDERVTGEHMLTKPLGEDR